MIDFQAIRGLLLLASSWVRQHQHQVIDYLIEENRVLLEQSKGRRVVLTDDQRRRLAAKGNVVGRRDLQQVATIVKADTILTRYRKLIVRSCSAPEKRPGRPRVRSEIRELVVRMAMENSRWGYRRIQGELKALGHRIARSTIANILRENGIKPAPDRPTSWTTFIKAHWGFATSSQTETTVANESRESGGDSLESHRFGETVAHARGGGKSRGLCNHPRVERGNQAADLPMDIALGLAASSPDRVQQVGPVSKFKEKRTLTRNRILFDCQPRAA